VSNLNSDQYAFGGRGNYAVHAEYDGREFQSNGVAFEDYSRMHTEQRKLSVNRTAPEWSFNSDKLRAVIVRAMECRAGFRKPQPGTDAERLARAQKRIDHSRRLLTGILDRLCAEFVAAKKAANIARTEYLAQKIEEQDTRLRVIPTAAYQLYAGCAYHCWRCGLDSVAAAQKLDLKPPHVRQTLWRMRKAAHQLGFGAAPRVGKKRDKNPERERARQFAELLKYMTWEKAKAAMGEPDTHNNKFRRILKKYGMWQPRTGAVKYFIKFVARAAAAREKGRSYADIGAGFGVPARAVMRILRQYHRDTPSPFKQELHKGRVNKAEAIALRQQGWTCPRIAQHFGVHTSAIYSMLKRVGVYQRADRQRAHDGTFKAEAAQQ